MFKTVSENGGLYELSRCRPWWNRGPMNAPRNPTKTKIKLAGKLIALAIVTAFVAYCAAALVRVLW